MLTKGPLTSKNIKNLINSYEYQLAAYSDRPLSSKDFSYIRDEWNIPASNNRAAYLSPQRFNHVLRAIKKKDSENAFNMVWITNQQMLTKAIDKGLVKPASLTGQLIYQIGQYPRFCQHLHQVGRTEYASGIQYQLTCLAQSLIKALQPLESWLDKVPSLEQRQELENNLTAICEPFIQELKTVLEADQTLSEEERNNLEKELPELLEMFSFSTIFKYGREGKKLLKESCQQVISLLDRANNHIIGSHAAFGNRGAMHDLVVTEANSLLAAHKFPRATSVNPQHHGQFKDDNEGRVIIDFALYDMPLNAELIHEIVQLEEEGDFKQPSALTPEKILSPYFYGWRIKPLKEAIFENIRSLGTHVLEDTLFLGWGIIAYVAQEGFDKSIDIPRGSLSWQKLQSLGLCPTRQEERRSLLREDLNRLETFIERSLPAAHSAGYMLAAAIKRVLADQAVGGSLQFFYDLTLKPLAHMENSWQWFKAAWTQNLPDSDQTIATIFNDLTAMKDQLKTAHQVKNLLPESTQAQEQNGMTIDRLVSEILKGMPTEALKDLALPNTDLDDHLKGDLFTSTGKGLLKFVRFFTHPLSKSPQSAFIFSAVYVFGAYSLYFNPTYSLSALNELKSWIATVGKALDHGQLSQAIAGGFTFAKLSTGLYDLATRGQQSWIASALQSLCKEPVDITLAITIASLFGKWIATDHSVFGPVQTYFAEELGDIPSITEMFVGLKIAMLTFELVQPHELDKARHKARLVLQTLNLSPQQRHELESSLCDNVIVGPEPAQRPNERSQSDNATADGHIAIEVAHSSSTSPLSSSTSININPLLPDAKAKLELIKLFCDYGPVLKFLSINQREYLKNILQTQFDPDTAQAMKVFLDPSSGGDAILQTTASCLARLLKDTLALLVTNPLLAGTLTGIAMGTLELSMLSALGNASLFLTVPIATLLLPNLASLILQGWQKMNEALLRCFHHDTPEAMQQLKIRLGTLHLAQASEDWQDLAERINAMYQQIGTAIIEFSTFPLIATKDFVCDIIYRTFCACGQPKVIKELAQTLSKEIKKVEDNAVEAWWGLSNPFKSCLQTPDFGAIAPHIEEDEGKEALAIAPV